MNKSTSGAMSVNELSQNGKNTVKSRTVGDHQDFTFIKEMSDIPLEQWVEGLASILKKRQSDVGDKIQNKEQVHHLLHNCRIKHDAPVLFYL